ncbi:uncharacterized protein LOC131649907 [Vicia villosa]|uniref:uncharacterized protein LOC131649907 n=1 Tax=Vicia villosa TaxID=3911 RepID=UPI00273C9E40|nr:uncharacterized protein LOC131649907 [Vicia villosa]
MNDMVKINTDGAIKNNRQAGCGGIIWDGKRNRLGGFSRYLGNCKAFVEELWGVLKGRKLARTLGMRKVEINVGSQLVVVALEIGKSNNVSGLSLIKRICELMEDFNSCLVSHVYRETNVCVDVLANAACALKHYCIYRYTLDYMKEFVLTYSN